MSALRYDGVNEEEPPEVALETPVPPAEEYGLNLQEEAADDERPSLGAVLPNGDPPSWMLWGVDDE